MATIVQTLTISDSTTGLRDSVSKTVTTAGSGASLSAQSIGTSEVEYTVPAEIGNAGACKIVNMDATNYVEVGFATGSYPLKILPGTFCLMQIAPATASLFLKANTAACVVSIYIHEA